LQPGCGQHATPRHATRRYPGAELLEGEQAQLYAASLTEYTNTSHRVIMSDFHKFVSVYLHRLGVPHEVGRSSCPAQPGQQALQTWGLCTAFLAAWRWLAGWLAMMAAPWLGSKLR
jgi:hypothetical protein